MISFRAFSWMTPLAMLLLANALGAPAASAAEPDDLTARMNKIIGDKRLAGAALLVVHNDKIVYEELLLAHDKKLVDDATIGGWIEAIHRDADNDEYPRYVDARVRLLLAATAETDRNRAEQDAQAIAAG